MRRYPYWSKSLFLKGKKNTNRNNGLGCNVLIALHHNDDGGVRLKADPIFGIGFYRTSRRVRRGFMLVKIRNWQGIGFQSEQSQICCLLNNSNYENGGNCILIGKRREKTSRKLCKIHLDLPHDETTRSTDDQSRALYPLDKTSSTVATSP